MSWAHTVADYFRRKPESGYSNLSQLIQDPWFDWEDEYRTDYTYATSRSYVSRGSDEYENPRMFRLPIGYYRRKWAFEEARKRGLLYYVYYCIMDYSKQFTLNPLQTTIYAIKNVFRWICRVLWILLDFVFPNASDNIVDTEIIHSASYEHSRLKKRFERSTIFNSSAQNLQTTQQDISPITERVIQSSIGNKSTVTFWQLLLNIATFGYYSPDPEISTRNESSSDNADISNATEYDSRSFDSSRIPSRGLKRRVKRTSYEYSEGPASNSYESSSSVTKKTSESIFRKAMTKVLAIALISVLSPLKMVESFGEKIFWLFDFRHLVPYNLRSEQSDRSSGSFTYWVANRLAGTIITCFLGAVEFCKSSTLSLLHLVIHLILAPVLILVYLTKKVLLISKILGSALARKSKIIGGLVRILFFPIQFIETLVSGCFSVIKFVHMVPYNVAEYLRENAAVFLAKSFGMAAAGLCGYEQVRFVKRKGLRSDSTADHVASSTTFIDRNVKECCLMPTSRSLKLSSIFWRWIFPILLLVLIMRTVSRGGNHEGINNLDAAHNATESASIGNKLDRIRETMTDAVYIAIRFISTVSLDAYSFVFMNTKSTAEKFIELPKYALSSESKISKAFSNVAESVCLFFRHISEMIWNVGQSSYSHFTHGLSMLYDGFQQIILKIYNIPQLFGDDPLIDILKEYTRSSCMMFLDFFRMIFAFFSNSISKAINFMLHIVTVDEKSDYDISMEVDKSKRDEMEADQLELFRMKNEKDILEEKMIKFREQRKFEEGRYRDLYEAVQVLEQSHQQKHDESQNILNDEDQLNVVLQNYISNLKKTESAELSERFSKIENRLSKQLDQFSHVIEDELSNRISHSKEETNKGQSILANELKDLSSAVNNLQSEFNTLRREKEAKIAEMAHAIMSRDAKQSDKLNIHISELSAKIKNDLEKEFSTSLDRFEEASLTDRQKFREEIMRMVENRVVTLFTSYLAERNKNEDSLQSAHSMRGLANLDLTAIQKMITDALDQYDADKTGKVDYALESSGASVVSTRCTTPYKETSRLESVFGIPVWYSSYSPRTVLQFRPLAAGECWAFRGKGYLVIKLSHTIRATEVSYEHLNSALHPDGILKSAPKHMQIYSYKSADDLESKFLLGDYEYDIEKRALQTFQIQDVPDYPVNVIELAVLSNWGAEYTCLYRFRVHGQKV